jgi:asparagine synthase (glutamine-hydrolysing)
MGAIFGIVGEGSLAELAAMGRRVAHRGRHQQYWSPAPGVYFGQAGHRPFEVNGSAIATDWQVTGDQSSLPERFAEHGPTVLGTLRGTFSLALCDAPGHIWLAVDHLGFKTLYYSVLRGRFVFASEYKSLLALPDFPLEPDRDAIQHYLATKHPLGGHSFLARTRPLPGGHVLEYQDRGPQVTSYWKPTAHVVDRSRQEHARVIRDTMLATVQRQVSPYEQIGITLGAGIDAAIVLGAVRRVAPDVRVSSFTIGAGESDWEIAGARETASLFDTDHHEYIFDPSVIPNDLPKLVWLSEDCGGREEAVLQMNVLAHAAAHTKTIFSGWNADLLFGGMPRHRLIGYAERMPLLSVPLRELFQLSQCGLAPSSLVGRALERAVYGAAPPRALQVPGAVAASGVYWTSDLNNLILANVQRSPYYNYLEPCHEVGAATWYSPFADPDLIAASLTVPSWLKTGWRQQKRVLREAAQGLVPDAIRKRKKAIQRLDIHGTMGEVLCDLAGQWLLDSLIREHDLLTASQLRQIRMERGRARQSREVAVRLWSVLSLECWARHFLSAERREPFAAPASP